MYEITSSYKQITGTLIKKDRVLTSHTHSHINTHSHTHAHFSNTLNIGHVLLSRHFRTSIKKKKHLFIEKTFLTSSIKDILISRPPIFTRTFSQTHARTFHLVDLFLHLYWKFEIVTSKSCGMQRGMQEGRG